MTTVGVIPASRLRDPSGNTAMDRLPQELNGMKIRDDKVSLGIFYEFGVSGMFMVRYQTRIFYCRNSKQLSLMVQGRRQVI